MANIKENVDDRSLADHIQEGLANISITTKPVVIVGVQRKANIGNFENIDVYAAVALPVDVPLFSSPEQLTQALRDAADYGFQLVGTATAERYNTIKEKKE